ncbi:MAG TPA: Rieske (2Fe-2S) protein [Chromatiales bacterium]|nr:Rieske (2Fe-2S) protein [Thiotrichales bacterium]HIP67490.1 Rieske (2Fe-2S) protein [Chromatiales bacterium]
MKQFLCKTTDLDATQAKSLTAEIEGKTQDIFVVRNAEGIFAYIDVCPHTGTPLEWREDHFLDEEFSHIICATHGAQFRIENGYCFAGPCKQRSLTALPLEINGNKIYLSD